MSNSPIKIRGGGYGLDAELARKASEKYDYDAEDEAREWIEEITKLKIGENFGEGLKNGIILCTLINQIQSNTIKKIQNSNMPFKQMENISAFLKACRTLGVAEFDLFETVDLYELKDLSVVVRCIHALGRAVQKNYPQFKGPTLGVKESTSNKRNFTTKQLKQGNHTVSKVFLGSSQTMERSEISKSTGITFGADSTNSPPKINSTNESSPPPIPIDTTTSSNTSSMNSSIKEAQEISYGKPIEESNQGNGNGFIPLNTNTTPPNSTPTIIPPAPEPKQEPEPNGAKRSPVKIRGGGYGLDAELARKAAEKYDYDAEEEAQEWIEEIIGEKFPKDFADSLKNGIILCKLINCLKPNTIKKIQDSKMPFKQMENISAFLKACRTLGVAEFDLFETVDLFEQKDLGVVVTCIHALGRAVQRTCPNFDGPILGVKESTRKPRSFSPEKLKASAASSISKISLGSSQTMDRSEITEGNSVTFGADCSGTGDSNAIPVLAQASRMERKQLDVSNNITFGYESSRLSLADTTLPSRTTWE